MADGNRIKDDVLAVDLIKNPWDAQIQAKNDRERFFYSFGYYDTVRIRKIQTAKDLYEITTGYDVDTERTILIPWDKDQESNLERKASFGIISFLTMGEDNEEELIDYCSRINRMISTELSDCNVYLSGGASAIALLYLIPQGEQIPTKLKTYFEALQRIVSCQKRCLYSYSLMLMNPFSKVEDEDCLPGVQITLSKDKNALMGTYLQTCAEITKHIGGELLTRGSITGTDDYAINIKNVPLHKFHQTFLTMRELGLSEEGPFSSSFTTIMFQEDGIPGDSSGIDLTSLTKKKKKRKEIDQSDPNARNIEKVQGKLRTIPGLIDVRLKFHEFQELWQLPYTEWTYRQYKEIVATFGEMLLEEIQTQKNYGNAVENSNKFFAALSGMLESLLNTSAYFTDSPGYRRVDNNSIPRFIVIYQNMINRVISAWDDYIRSYRENHHPGGFIPQRKHLILLSVKNYMTVSTDKYFSELPPDKRIISIRVPLYQGFRPDAVIPRLFHEAGHHVGVRKRSSDEPASRRNLFLEVVWNEFIIEFLLKYEWLYKKIDSFSIDDGRILLMFFIYMYDDLLDELKDTYHEIKLARKKWIRENHEMYTDEFIDRKCYMLEEDYFEQMTALTSCLFHDMVLYGKEDFQVDMDGYFEYLEQGNDVHRQKIAGTYDRICWKFNNVFDKLGRDILQGQPRFISRSQSYFSEIAADVFMVNMCNLSSAEYAYLIFEDYLSNNPDTRVVEWIKADAKINVRMCSVYMALKELNRTEALTKKDQRIEDTVQNLRSMGSTLNPDEVKQKFHEFQLWLDKLTDILQRRIEQTSNLPVHQQWKQLYERITNPVWIMKDYAKDLLRDERYYEDFVSGVDETKKNDLWELVKRVRSIYTDAGTDADLGAGFANAYRNLFTDAFRA